MLMPSSLSVRDPLSPAVLRSLDLLNLRFEFKNLTVVTGSGLPSPPPPQLVGVSGQTAFIVVDFPPQHILEQVLTNPGTPPNPPYPAILSGPSRLTFAVPDAMLPVPYRLQDVLSLLTQLTPLAPSETPADVGGTAIEFPYGLVLAPIAGAQGRLFHRRDEGASSQGWVELWHTRLGTASGDGTSDGAGAPILQAALTSPSKTDPPFPPFDTTSLTSANYADIAAQSAQNGGRIFAEQFVLSSLGASIRLRSAWPQPAPPNVNLEAWEHASNFARDYYVRTVTHGFLFPFGHGASRTTIVRREFGVPAGFASLVEDSFVTVREQVKTYDDSGDYTFQGREMPLKRITIASPLQQSAPSGDPPFSLTFTVVAQDSRRGPEIVFDVPMLYVENVDANFDFNGMLQLYSTQNSADLGGQLVAIADDPDGRGDTLLKVMNMYFGAENPPLEPPFLPSMLQADVGIPAVDHYLAAPPAASMRRASYALYRHSASPRGGSSSPSQSPGSGAGAAAPPIRITLNQQYLTGSGDTQVFADLASALPPLPVPAERAGGLCAPAFQQLDSISRSVGPTNASPSVSPIDLIGDAKLFGTILLRDLLGDLGNLPSQIDNPEALAQLFDIIDAPGKIDDPLLLVPRPILSTVNIPAPSPPAVSGQAKSSSSATAGPAVETRFIWKPPIKTDGLPPPLAVIPAQNAPQQNVVLVCKGRVVTPLTPDNSPNGKPSFEVVGTLAYFSVLFADLIEVQFDHVTFTAGSEKNPSIDPKIDAIKFAGSLQFLNALTDLLSTGLDGAPGSSLLPTVTVGAGGAVVRFDLAIPSVAIGILSLQNIAVMSSLSLPFVEGVPMAVDFGLSERDHPFLVTVGIFGGGGFFALEARSDERILVEAAIEFGANVAFDIGVAAGGVYFFAGIYFSSGGNPLVTAYIRCGGYLEVLQIVSVSVEFYLSLSYVEADNSLEGSASLTIGVKTPFFNTSVTLSVHKKIASLGTAQTLLRASATAPPPTFVDVVSPDQWAQYCRAFA
jgi:hypothetical protein